LLVLPQIGKDIVSEVMLTNDKMVLTFLRHLVSQHPSKPLLIQAVPLIYENPNQVYVEKKGVFLEIDSNKYMIYVEPRARSLLLIVEHDDVNISTDYHKFSREVVSWKDDSEYGWVQNVKRITSIHILHEERQIWEPLELECSVCLKPEEQCYTPCGHVVCQVCLGKWYRRNRRTCPVCRADLTAEFMRTGDMV
jgi:hypothetical protein